MRSDWPATGERRHGLANVAKQQSKWTVQGSVTGNHDIVAGPEFPLFKVRRESRLQPAANTVTRNRVANFLCDREPETGPRAGALRRVGSFTHFNQKRRRG